jgi:hypothetical protein
MAVEQTQPPLRRWSTSFAPYNSILRTRSLLTPMGADASSLACAMSSPNDFSQLLGSDSEMPVRCHGLYHCTCPFGWHGGLAAFIELEGRFTWSQPPAIPVFCHIRMPHQNSTMSLAKSAKKLRGKATIAKNRPPPTSLPRTPRSSRCVRFVAAASKACDAKPAVSERASHLTFLAS